MTAARWFVASVVGLAVALVLRCAARELSDVRGFEHRTDTTWHAIRLDQPDGTTLTCPVYRIGERTLLAQPPFVIHAEPIGGDSVRVSMEYVDDARARCLRQLRERGVTITDTIDSPRLRWEIVRRPRPRGPRA